MRIDGGDLGRYVQEAFERGATDILLTVGAPPMLRVEGRIRPVTDATALDERAIHSYLDVLLTDDQRQEFGRHDEVDFAGAWAGKARLRGNAFWQRGLPAVALRMIPDLIPSFDDLGMPSAVRELARLPQGLVLFTGPTGSGKSTSLAALVDWINDRRACHILTIEDPIEYVYANKRALVNQREVGADTHSFERALRAALREDPDVLLVGEMRDPESIAIALTLAETGHLVFSTLHTNDTAQALDRIVDVFPSERQDQIRIQLSGTLMAVVAQRLLPRTGGGLVAAFEVLLASSAVRNLVREGKTRQIRNVIITSQASGMQTLEHSLEHLVRQGLVSYDDAVGRALYPKEISRPAPPAPPGGARRARA